MTDPDASPDTADNTQVNADQSADKRTPPRTAGQERPGRSDELWTLEDVQDYLGHTQSHSAAVWLSRHGIKGVRMYNADEVRRRREITRPNR